MRSLLLVLAAPLVAQAPPSDELLRLEPLVQAALRKAAPFTVTVETFGGTRRLEGKDGEFDGDAPPPPKPKPEPKPEPEPEPLPEPWPDVEPHDKPEQDRKKDDDDIAPKAPKDKGKPLVAAGFAQALGRTSGVVLTADGWIVVSRFALALEPTTVLVTVPGRGTFRAERGGEDTSRGIALVKIAATDLPVPEFVPKDRIQVGQWVLALGRTFAVDLPTVHFGIVSAKERLFGRALQIDAYTSPANYGGPVVDIEGRLLGIAVPLSPSGRNAGVEWYDSGIGFATTLVDVPQLLQRLQQGEVLQRAWLGVRFDGKHLGPGAKIAAVVPGSAAAAAELAAGDLVVSVGGVSVRNGAHLQILVNGKLGGDKIVLLVRRGEVDLAAIEVVLRDAPWREQKQGSDGEAPAGFPPPVKPEGR